MAALVVYHVTSKNNRSRRNLTEKRLKNCFSISYFPLTLSWEGEGLSSGRRLELPYRTSWGVFQYAPQTAEQTAKCTAAIKSHSKFNIAVKLDSIKKETNQATMLSKQDGGSVKFSYRLDLTGMVVGAQSDAFSCFCCELRLIFYGFKGERSRKGNSYICFFLAFSSRCKVSCRVDIFCTLFITSTM